MGCIVNGPGEAKDADLGIAFGKRQAALFLKGSVLKRVSKDMIIDAFRGRIEKANITLRRIDLKYSQGFIPTLKEDPREARDSKPLIDTSGQG